MSLRTPVRTGVSPERRWRGYGLAVALPVAMTVVIDQFGTGAGPSLASDLLAFLLAVVVVALVGGFGPALAAAVIGSGLINYFFTPPFHTLSIASRDNAFAIVVFVVVAALVSAVVDLAARRTREADQAAADARVLVDVAGIPVTDRESINAMLERFRAAFDFAGVSLLTQSDDGWVALGRSEGTSPDDPATADVRVSAGNATVLAMAGPTVEWSRRRLIDVVAVRAREAADRVALAEVEAHAAQVAETDRVRTALLAAVGHDFRTPLAASKTAVSGLLSQHVTLAEADRIELLETADVALDRLAALVDNLLDMSRLQAGAVPVRLAPVEIADVIAVAMEDLTVTGRPVLVEVPDDLPQVSADAGLLERVVVNVLANALRFSPAGAPPRLEVVASESGVAVHIIDHGPGLDPARFDDVFVPFQRLGDTDNTTGIGLGLAVARGLIEAMGGSITPSTTDGGGLTMTIALGSAE